MKAARVVSDGKVITGNTFRALVWAGDGAQVLADLVLVPATFFVGKVREDTGIGIALAGNPGQPILVMRGDSARVMLHELMRHVRIDEAG